MEITMRFLPAEGRAVIYRLLSGSHHSFLAKTTTGLWSAKWRGVLGAETYRSNSGPR